MKKTLTYLIAIAVLMLIGISVSAQDGSGTRPFAGSTHSYSIIPDANTTDKSYLWEVSGGGAINGSATGTSVTIDWGTSAGTYTITFTETDDNNNCISVREMIVEVIANPFYLTMSADAVACHDSTGQILTDGSTGPTTLYFTVNMESGSYPFDTWEFDFTVSIAGSYTLNSVKVEGVTVAPTVGIYEDNSVASSESSAEIAVEIEGPVTSLEDITVLISNGKAIKGTSVTPDNGNGDSTQKLTVNPLPDTGDIQAN